MKRVILILVVLITTMIAFGERTDVQAAGPELSVENTRIDLGEIKAGNDAVATFVFHNSGSSDVKIIKAKPS